MRWEGWERGAVGRAERIFAGWAAEGCGWMSGWCQVGKFGLGGAG